MINNDGLQVKNKNIKNEIEEKIKNNEKIFFKRDNHYYKLTETKHDTCEHCDFEDINECQNYGCIACSLSGIKNEIYYILKEIEKYEMIFGYNNENI